MFIDRIFQKLNFISGLFAIGSVFALVAFVANIEIKDLDLWLHLASGKYISQHGYVPLHDIFSFTLNSKPWINHEWLFQVVLYRVFENWGFIGLNYLQVVLVLTTLLVLLILGYMKDRQWLTATLLFLVFLVYQQRFTLRPDLFSLLFFAFYIFVLSMHIDKKWATPAIFVTQLLWVNMHGYFFFGPLFILIGIVSEWIKRSIPLPYQWNDSGRLTNQEYGRLKLLFIVCVIACLFNPHGFKGAWYPIWVFFSLSSDNKIFFEYIQELAKPITWHTLFDHGQYSYYRLTIFLSALTFILNRKRLDVSAVFLWVVFLIFSLMAVRNLSYFVFAAFLVMSVNIYQLKYEDLFPFRFSNKKFQDLTLVFLHFIIISMVLNYSRGITHYGYYDYDSYTKKSEYGGLSKRTYPYKAADFLEREKVTGRLFNDFNSGAYLIGRLFPQLQVYIDGRTELYGGEFFSQYTKVWDEGKLDVLTKLDKEYHFTGAFLNSVRHHIPSPVINMFYSQKEWKMVYLDFDGVIFLRDIEQNRQLIEQFEVDLSDWNPPRVDLYKVGTHSVVPYQHYYRAQTMYDINEFDAALLEIEQGLLLNPGHAQLYHLRGKIYHETKQNEKAYQDLRIAAMMMPTNREAQLNVGLSLKETGHYNEAVRQFENVIKRWPQVVPAYFYLAFSQVKIEHYDNAYHSLVAGLQRQPDNVQDTMDIGDEAVKQGAFEVAKKIYLLQKDSPALKGVIERKMGYLSHQQGRYQQAMTYFNEALKHIPDDEKLLSYIRETEAYLDPQESTNLNAVEKATP